VARSITKASTKAEPLGETFSVTSSVPKSPNSARAENPVFRARLASFPAAALLIVASCDPPALFRSVAAALILNRFEASGEAPPRPKPSAVTFAAAAPIAVTLAAKVTVGVLMIVLPSAPAVVEPKLMTVVDPAAPPVPRFTVLVTPVVVLPVPSP